METAKIEFATSRKSGVCASGCEARALPTELRPRQKRDSLCTLDLIYMYVERSPERHLSCGGCRITLAYRGFLETDTSNERLSLC